MSTKKQKETVVPTNPQWATDAIQGITGRVSDLSNLSPESLIAGTNPLLDRAAGTLLGNPFGSARDMIQQGAGGGGGVGYHRVSDFMKNYESPYTKDVVDSALADFDFGAGKARAQQDLDLAGANAFGGSAASLTKSMTEGELARGRASTSAGLRDQAFARAAELGGKDAASFTAADATNAQLAESRAARMMQGGTALAGLTSQELGQQLSLGEYLRNIEQQRLQAPITLAQQQAGIIGGLPLGNYTGRNTTTTQSDPMGSLGTALMTGGALFGAPFTGGASLAGLAGLGSAAGTMGGMAAGGLRSLGGLFGGR